MTRPDETILIVDDEAVVRRAVSRLLRNLGYEVLLAADGAEGVTTFEANRARIAMTVLDMVMPRQTGDVAGADLTQRTTGGEVCLLVGDGQEDLHQHRDPCRRL